MDSIMQIIPGGLISKLQSLEKVINKPFKDAIKKKYV